MRNLAVASCLLAGLAACGNEAKDGSGGGFGAGGAGGWRDAGGSGGTGGSTGPFVVTSGLVVKADGTEIGYLTSVYAYHLGVLDVGNGVSFWVNSATGFVGGATSYAHETADCSEAPVAAVGDAICLALDHGSPEPPFPTVSGDATGDGGYFGWTQSTLLYVWSGAPQRMQEAAREADGVCTPTGPYDTCAFALEETIVIPTAFATPITVEPPQ